MRASYHHSPASRPGVPSAGEGVSRNERNRDRHLMIDEVRMPVNTMHRHITVVLTLIFGQAYTRNSR